MNFKRIISSVLAVIMLIGVCSALFVYAEPNDGGVVNNDSSGNSSEQSSKNYARSLISFTRTKNALDINSVSTDELRVFGTFVSNFFVPFQTKVGGLSNSDFKEVFKTRFFNASNSASGKDTNDADITKILQLVDNGMSNNTEPLYVKDANGNMLDASLKGLFEGRPLYRKTGEVVFGAEGGDQLNIMRASIGIALAVNPKGGNDYINNNIGATSGLTIDPFGNICHSGVVVIPGCLNPYTFVNTSANNASMELKLPLNNAFSMGSFLNVTDNILLTKEVKGGVKKDFTQWVSGNKLIDTTKDRLIEIYGLGVAGRDHNDNYVQMFLGDVGQKYKVDANILGFGGWTTFKDYKNKALRVPLNLIQDEVGDFVSTNAWEGTQTSGINEYKLLTKGDGGYQKVVLTPMTDLDTPLNIDAGRVGGKNTLRGVCEWVNGANSTDYWSRIITASQTLDVVYTNVQYASVDNVCKLVRGDESVNYEHSTFLFGLEGNIANILVAANQPVAEGGIVIANDTNVWGGIYWAYLLKILGFQPDNENAEYKYTGNILPTLNVGLRNTTFGFEAYLDGVESENSAENEVLRKQKEIVNRVYNLLDDKSNTYRNTWINSTISGFILAVHNSMIGSDFANNVMSIGGGGNNSGNYQSVVGYVTTPTLDNLPYTAWFYDNYTFIYAAVLCFVLVILIIGVAVGHKSFKSAIVMFLCIAGVFLMPKIVINAAVNTANSVNESVFGNRFEFWAVVQHQQALQNQKDASVQVSIMDDLQKAKDFYHKNGLTVKWMAPKKADVFDVMFSKKYNNESIRTNTKIFKWLFSGELNQERYSSDPMATYLYRPYIDIASSAANGYSKLGKKETSVENVGGEITSNWRSGGFFERTMKGRENRVLNGNYLNSINNGYHKGYLYYVGQSDRYNLPRNEYKTYSHIIEPLTDSVVNKAMFNSRIENIPNANIGIDLKANDLTSKSGGNMYLLYTESPYYYFYNVFKNVETQQMYSGDTDFSSVLLSPDFFKVKASESVDIGDGKKSKNQRASNIDGELKDFLDLEGLFTYIVPYMNYGNSYVKAWGEAYGIDATDISYDELNAMKNTIGTTGKSDSEKKINDALVHKQNLEKVWNMYAPWVDALYDSGVYNQKAKSGGNRVVIMDSLNPAVYDEAGRPMAFGPADALVKGYVASDLTSTEKKINAVLEETYKDLLYLNNYYGFDNEVLVSVAAMTATFNFNKHFSNAGWFGNDIVLNPQSFELNAMNYDAFLRLVLLNATGEPLVNEAGGLYERVISSTNVFTGIVLLITDFIAIYIVPLAVIILLTGLTILGILFVVDSIMSDLKESKGRIFKTFLKPLVTFLGCSILHALLISMCVGEGITDLVGSRGITFTTNDPTITLLLLLCIDSVYAYILVRQIIVVFKEGKGLVASIGASTGSLIRDGALLAGGAVLGKSLVDDIRGVDGSGGRNKDSENIDIDNKEAVDGTDAIPNPTVDISQESDSSGNKSGDRGSGDKGSDVGTGETGNSEASGSDNVAVANTAKGISEVNDVVDEDVVELENYKDVNLSSYTNARSQGTNVDDFDYDEDDDIILGEDSQGVDADTEVEETTIDVDSDEK